MQVFMVDFRVGFLSSFRGGFENSCLPGRKNLATHRLTEKINSLHRDGRGNLDTSNHIKANNSDFLVGFHTVSKHTVSNFFKKQCESKNKKTCLTSWWLNQPI